MPGCVCGGRARGDVDSEVKADAGLSPPARAVAVVPGAERAGGPRADEEAVLGRGQQTAAADAGPVREAARPPVAAVLLMR